MTEHRQGGRVMGLWRMGLCAAMAVVMAGLWAPASSRASPVVLPGSVLKRGGVSAVEIVAPQSSASCSITFAGARRYGPYRLALGGPTRIVRWKMPKSARGTWAGLVVCRDAAGTSMGIAKVSLVVGHRGRSRGRFVRARSLRVLPGSIPELATRPVARTTVSEDVNTADPRHPFHRCNGTWVASTRTTGEGLGTYIQFEPTAAARRIWRDTRAVRGQDVPAYGQMWEELNRCANFTPDLNDTQRHSLYVQMACHGRYGATFFGGGNTWDLEAWRQDVSWETGMSRSGSCGQNYGNVADGEAGRFLLGRLVNAYPDPNPDHRKAWLVEMDGATPVRRHVASTTAYGCLVAAGHPAARWFPALFLELVPERGEKTDATSCPKPQSQPQRQPQPQPAPRTWPEQQGSLGANTFTNPYNASGMGVKIQPYQWVNVACKVYAPQITSANPDGYWYRIASSPWNRAYYAVANTFWNGDVPGQKPYTHNTDFNVPNC